MRGKPKEGQCRERRPTTLGWCEKAAEPQHEQHVTDKGFTWETTRTESQETR